jgi:hypothetical protein
MENLSDDEIREQLTNIKKSMNAVYGIMGNQNMSPNYVVTKIQEMQDRCIALKCELNARKKANERKRKLVIVFDSDGDS